jgi:hypothetical protein
VLHYRGQPDRFSELQRLARFNKPCAIPRKSALLCHGANQTAKAQVPKWWEGVIMNSWLRNCFRDPKSAFASTMAIAGIIGMICCFGIILIVLFAR